jgi:general secretion pathway protein D
MAGAMSLPELKPISRQIHSLKMNNQPVRVLYETVGKLAGINVVFDSEFQPPPGRNFSVDLTNTTLEEALDYLAVLTKTFWKPLSQNTIFVTNDNVTKRRDYEDLVVKVFYLQNITSVQELTEVATNIRAITDLRRIFNYNAQNALIVRGTADQVALAEKLIQDMDKPKAEVVVDVIVMETARGRTRELAASLVTPGGQPGLQVPIQFTPRNPVLTGTDNDNGNGDGDDGNNGGSGTPQNPLVSLARIGRISTNDFSVTLPGAILSALMTDRSTNVLQSPQVRASDRMKASLRIGDRVPTATGSFQPGVGAIGVSPLVNTQFQFIEVGVNVI